MNGLTVDLMGDVVLTQHEIDQRVIAEIRRKYTPDDEFRLARIASGSLMGRYTPSQSEQADIDAYEAHVLAARAAGQQMATDNDLLKRTLDYERAQERLNRPALDPTATDANGDPLYPDIPEIDRVTGKPTGNLLPNPAIVQDTDERTAAQAVVDGTQQDAIDQATLRAAARAKQGGI